MLLFRPGKMIFKQMKLRMKPVILLLSFLIASISASGQDSLATIYFYRPAKGAGAAISFIVYQDTSRVGRLTPGNILNYRCRPGKKWFRAKTADENYIHLELKSGETYYIECGLSVGAFVGRPTFRQVFAAEAREAFRRINPYAVEFVKEDGVTVIPQQKDTVRALNNLFQRKRKGGTTRAIVFGLLGLSSLVGTASGNSDPGNFVFIGFCGIMAITGGTQSAKYRNPEPVIRDFQAGKGIPQLLKGKLKRKDFK